MIVAKAIKSALFYTAISLLSLPVFAEQGQWSGSLGVESQLFINNPAWSQQKRHAGALLGNLEYYRDFNEGDARLSFDGRFRLDSHDNNKNVADIQDLYWWQQFEQFELTAGIRKVFWGVAETVHLVDTINQTDVSSNIDGEDKLGQPMVSALIERDWGSLEAFALFGFREQEYAGKTSRLRSAIIVDDSAATFQSSAGTDHLDFALRYGHVLGDWDLGLSYFSGTDRAPIFIIGENNTLKPHYQLINQVGLDVQATIEAWLWKLEAIAGKVKNGSAYAALVGGAEYTFYGINDSAADLGVVVEYQFDDREQRQANNDLALALRLALNNTQSTEVLAAIMIDLDNKSQFLSLEASHRLTDHWKLSLESRWFSNIAEQDLMVSLADDDYVSFTLTRHF